MGPTRGDRTAGERGTGRPGAGEGPRVLADAIRDAIRDYPDFPRPGILFRDIVPVLADPGLLRRVTGALADVARGWDADRVAGIESRGFLLGTPVALELGVPFVPVRKRGKLPGETVSVEYELEYGTAHLELQSDRIETGDRVVMIDDLLATGGTASAAASLVERLGGRVAGMAFLVELAALDGRRMLDKHNLLSLLIL